MPLILAATPKAPPGAGANALRRVGKWLAALLLLQALAGCAWLVERQSLLALRPTAGLPETLPPEGQLFRPGDRRWLVDVPATRIGGHVAPGTDRLALWWLPAADPAAPALLYLHGTFRSLYGNRPKVEALREAGFSVLAVDYRGWGESTAIVPDEHTIAADALVAWAELQRRQPLPGRRVIFGHSMGGAVAVRLAASLQPPQDYGALVVESSFTRMRDVAVEAGAWGRLAAWLTTLDFDAVGAIGQVQAPVLLMHGSADRTVPVVLGRRLRDAALAGATADPARVQWVEFEGGNHSHLHRDFPQAWRQALQDLAARLPAGFMPSGPSRSPR